jgi:O-methyltransferase
MNTAFDRLMACMSPSLDKIAEETSKERWIAFADLRLVLAGISYVFRNKVRGDIVEMGCACGCTSLAMRKTLEWLGCDKPLHVCDSFAGLPASTAGDNLPGFDADRFHEGVFTVAPSVVLNKFEEAHLKPPVIHEGWFKDITDYPTEIALTFLDGDLYQSIYDGLSAAYPRTAMGGLIVVHDYRYDPLPGARKACDEFFAGKEYVMPYADSAVIIRGA